MAIIGSLCWALSSIFARKAQLSHESDIQIGIFITIVINNLMNLIAVSIMLLVHTPIKLEIHGLILFALGGLLNSCIGRAMYFHGVGYVGAARGSAVRGLSPFFALLGGIFLLNEQLSSGSWLGIIIVLCGTTLVSWDSLQKRDILYTLARGEESNHDESNVVRRFLLKGISICAISSFFFAMGNVSRKAGMYYLPNSIIGVSVGSFAGLIGYIIYLMYFGRMKDIKRAIAHPNSDYVYSGILAGIFLYFMFLSYQYITVSESNTLQACDSLFTTVISALILKNRDVISKNSVIACVLISIGSIILIWK